MMKKKVKKETKKVRNTALWTQAITDLKEKELKK